MKSPVSPLLDMDDPPGSRSERLLQHSSGDFRYGGGLDLRAQFCKLRSQVSGWAAIPMHDPVLDCSDAYCVTILAPAIPNFAEETHAALHSRLPFEMEAD